MSDLIDRSKLPTIRITVPTHIGNTATRYIVEAVANGFQALIESAPTVDAVEVIRCKDCEHWRSSPFGVTNLGWCIIIGHHRRPDYYCASADPKATKEVKADG